MITTAKDLFKRLKENSDAFDFNSVSNDLLKSKDVIRGIISKGGHFLKKLPEEIIDSEIATISIQKSLSNFEYLPEKYRFNISFIESLHFENSEDLCILKFTNKVLLNDKKLILNLLNKFSDNVNHFHAPNDNLYFYLGKKLKMDKEVINAAQNISPIIFKDTPQDLREDINFCKPFIYEYLPNLEFAGVSIKSNRDLIKELCSKSGRVITYVKDYFGSDKEIAELAVSNYGIALEYLSPELQNDLEIVKLAINQNPTAVKFASVNLKDNNEVIEIAITKDGYTLEFASDRLKNDESVVSKAINYKRTEESGGWGITERCSSGGAFKFASERVRGIKELAILALQNEGDYGPEDSWGNVDHQSDKPLFAYLPETISNNKDIVINAIKNNLESVKYINPSIRDEEDIKTLIREHKELQKENNKTKSDDGWG